MRYCQITRNIALILFLLALALPAYAGRYDGLSDMARNFKHFGHPPTQTHIPNGYGTHNTITNKLTTDPVYPSHRFENTITRDDNYKIISKQTEIYDSRGNTKAVK